MFIGCAKAALLIRGTLTIPSRGPTTGMSPSEEALHYDMDRACGSILSTLLEPNRVYATEQTNIAVDDSLKAVILEWGINIVQDCARGSGPSFTALNRALMVLSSGVMESAFHERAHRCGFLRLLAWTLANLLKPPGGLPEEHPLTLTVAVHATTELLCSEVPPEMDGDLIECLQPMMAAAMRLLQENKGSTRYTQGVDALTAIMHLLSPSTSTPNSSLPHLRRALAKHPLEAVRFYESIARLLAQMRARQASSAHVVRDQLHLLALLERAVADPYTLKPAMLKFAFKDLRGSGEGLDALMGLLVSTSKLAIQIGSSEEAEWAGAARGFYNKAMDLVCRATSNIFVALDVLRLKSDTSPEDGDITMSPRVIR